MLKLFLVQEAPRFVYKKGDGATHSGGAKAADEVAEDAESPVGTGLSVDDLLKLREDKQGLEAFINDYNEIEEEKRQQEKTALQKSAAERLKLSQQVDDKKLDDEEKEQLAQQAEDDATEFSHQFFEAVHDDSLDVEEKVKRVDELLAGFQKRVEAKAKEKEKHEGVITSLNKGKAMILGAITTFSAFTFLPLLWQKKIKDMENNPELTAQDVAKQASTIIEKETGEKVDIEDFMIAKNFSGAKEVEEVVDAAGNVVKAEESIVDTVKSWIGMVDGNVYAHAFAGMAKACGVEKGALAACAIGEGGDLPTAKALHERVDGVTYESLLSSFGGNAAQAKQAWGYVEQWQRILGWLDTQHDEIKDVIDGAVERLPDLDREDQDALKEEMQPENMRIAQIAFAMFGDRELVRDWLIRTPNYIQRSLKAYKMAKYGLSGALIKYMQPSRGFKAQVEAHSTGFSDRMRHIELDSGLELKGLKDADGKFKVIDDLIDDIDKFQINEEVSEFTFAERNKRVDAFQKTVGVVEERFKVVANELAEKGKIVDDLQVSAGRNLAGRKLGDLAMDARSKDLVKNLLGRFDEAMPLDRAFEQMRDSFAKKTKGISELQDALNERILHARGALVTKVLEPFKQAVKVQLRGKKVPDDLISEIRKNGTIMGKAQVYGPKLAMPIFGIGVSLWQGISQKQGLKKTALMVTEAGLSFVPYVGGLMDVGLGMKGYDLSGNKLSTFERASYVGFGAVSFVADLFGGYALRAGLAAIIKGRRGIKAVKNIGETKSLLMRGTKTVSEFGRLWSKPGRLGHLENALQTAQNAAGPLRAKLANGTASWMDKWKLGRLDAKIATMEGKKARLASQVTAGDVAENAAKTIKGNTIKSFENSRLQRIACKLQTVGCVGGLAAVISQGNISPVDMAEYGGKAVGYGLEGVGWGVKQIATAGDIRNRAVDQMMAAYYQEKKFDEMSKEKAEEAGEDTLQYAADHMDIPEVRTVAARSGLSGSDFLKSDSGHNLAEANA